MSEPITMQGTLEAADALVVEQKALRARVVANRQLATLLVKNGQATPEEAARVNALYPPHKTKKAAGVEDVTPTPEVAPGREDGPTADETPAQGPGTTPPAEDKPADVKPAAKDRPTAK